MSTTYVDLLIKAGQPYARRFRLVDGKDVWPALSDFEVRSQIRERRAPIAALLANFAPFITMSYEGNDIVGTISLTGAQTRTLPGGVYDIVLSDPGDDDARLIPVLSGTIKILRTIVTAPA